MIKNNSNLKDLIKNKKNILVFDFMYCGGGAYIYLQNLIYKYKNNTNFIIIREFEDKKYVVSLNDNCYLNIFTFENFNKFYIDNEKYFDLIFVNSLSTNSNKFNSFIMNLEKYKIGISHDFSILYNKSEIYPNENKSLENIKKNFDLIITQTKITNSLLKAELKKIVVDMPDHYKKKDLINTENNKIHIAVIGNISEIKGIKILKNFINFLNKENINNLYYFKIFGTSWPYLQKYTQPYKDINDLNQKLINYKPNIIIETSLLQETWSYTLTLAMTTDLPILYYKKNFENNISYRLLDYNKKYEWEDCNQLIYYINKYKQNYFFTIDSNIIFPRFYDSLFSDNFIENIIIISSKIVIENNNSGYNYSKVKSIYNTEERMIQTLETIKSVKDKFKNKNYKILLIDNSKFNDEMFNLICSNVDIFLNYKNIDNIDYYTNITKIKGMGETAQTYEVIKYLKKKNITFCNLFKISGRYLINDNFNYKLFDNNYNNFKLAEEIISLKPHVKNYYYTSLFKINYNYFDDFILSIELIINNENLFKNTLGYEELLPKLLMKFNKNSIKTIKTLGLTQNISVWDTGKYQEQLNI